MRYYFLTWRYSVHYTYLVNGHDDAPFPIPTEVSQTVHARTLEEAIDRGRAGIKALMNIGSQCVHAPELIVCRQGEN